METKKLVPCVSLCHPLTCLDFSIIFKFLVENGDIDSCSQLHEEVRDKIAVFIKKHSDQTLIWPHLHAGPILPSICRAKNKAKLMARGTL